MIGPYIKDWHITGVAVAGQLYNLTKIWSTGCHMCKLTFKLPATSYPFWYWTSTTVVPLLPPLWHSKLGYKLILLIAIKEESLVMIDQPFHKCSDHSHPNKYYTILIVVADNNVLLTFRPLSRISSALAPRTVQWTAIFSLRRIPNDLTVYRALEKTGCWPVNCSNTWK